MRVIERPTLHSAGLQDLLIAVEHGERMVRMRNRHREQRRDGGTQRGVIVDAASVRVEVGGIERLDRGESLPTSLAYPVQTWQFGEQLTTVFLAGEVVVDYALRFKREFGASTWVCGYADDMIAYIPSRRVWEEGGYEGGSSLYEYGRPAFRWSGEVEPRIATAVRELVEHLQRVAPGQ